MQKITVLGATGSIGVSTLDVLSRHRDQWQVFALTAFRKTQELAEQCIAHQPAYAWIDGATRAQDLEDTLRAAQCKTQVLHTAAELETLCSHAEVDAVMAAIVGAAGLAPTMAAACAGKRILLANKESLVMGGALFMQAVNQSGATLLPIDSEHSAIFQSLPANPAEWHQGVERLILTASGGPFRTRAPSTLGSVTPQEAVAHPNWVMGQKISVDSATMMNKALEVIEAHYLFGFAPQKIEVIIHPQSVIHSMVEYADGAVMAQLGTPDMRMPISLGLAWPQRIASGAKRIDFSTLQAMTFETADSQRFPGLPLAWQALSGARGATAVLNAANEVAVAAFLAGRIRFTDIYTVNAHTLEQVQPGTITLMGDVIDADLRARHHAQAMLARLH